MMLQKVGCDWVFDSDAIEDKCGVCKGDGTKCKPVEGVYNETKITSRKFFLSNFFSKRTFLFIKEEKEKTGLLYPTTVLFNIFFSEIMKIVTIPKGARSISVKEMGPHPNYLAVKVSNTNNYCLNKDL